MARSKPASTQRAGFGLTGLQVVVGCNGPVGTGLMAHLARLAVPVRGVCRSGRAEAPPGVEVVAADVADPEAASAACAGAAVVYCAVGLDYRVWLREWPPVVEGVLAAARAAGARLVFCDNLYAYGPQTVPLREDLPATTHGRKPALRARLAARMLEEHAAGRLPVAIVRASDFYGPRVRNAMLGERVFSAAVAGRPAQTVGDPDVAHTFTYVPDLVRALIAVAADPGAYGEIWHVPSAPASSMREVVAQVFALAGREPRLQALPIWLLRLAGLASPLMRELAEMRFQWDRPYLVDHAKFEARWGKTFKPLYTPLAEGLAATLEWYRKEEGKIR